MLGAASRGALWVRNNRLATFQLSPGGLIRGAQEAPDPAQLHVGPAVHVVTSAAGEELLTTGSGDAERCSPGLELHWLPNGPCGDITHGCLCAMSPAW